MRTAQGWGLIINPLPPTLGGRNRKRRGASPLWTPHSLSSPRRRESNGTRDPLPRPPYFITRNAALFVQVDVGLI